VNDHTLFITGASSGIGEACARRFVAAGARVILAARRVDRLAALQAELGERAWLLQLDVRDRASVLAAAEGLPEAFASVSVLVNNAGLALGLSSIEAIDLDDADTMIDTNLKGMVACTRALLPGMIARGRGHVINIGSVAGTYPYPGGNVYAGTKAFVHQFSIALRADLLGKGVRVTVVEPGMVETEFSRVRFKGDDERAATVYQNFAALTADDIAEAIFWASSQPPRVNVNSIELMPQDQAFGPFALRRG
jgi:NADP-dependent 3-hydroxy acid dehydrogenase YdfG